ncbi:MAG: polysaccharide biosynthesis protein [Gammaproteobacteria bacterium]|nr:polysaccharide biosynthesis protein [Gammaproteobacteria bacterium]
MPLSRRNKVILHDAVAIAAAWMIALYARFNFELPPHDNLAHALQALPVVLIVQGLIVQRFGLYRGVWRFASLQDLWNILRAAVLGAGCIGIALFVINRLEGIPRSMTVLYPMFLIGTLGGPRLMYRLWKDRSLSLKQLSSGQRTVIIGAGSGGETLVRDMLRGGGYVPVGFVDDRSSLRKARIHGVPILGAIDQLPRLAQKLQIELVLIAIPSATSAEMRRIVEICERTGLPFRTLPRLQDLVNGGALRELRDVSIDDLLGRAKVELDWQTIQSQLAGKAVLVTGGGGSIGSELCRQVARLGAGRLVVFERSEHHLYLVERELRASHPRLDLHCVLGDVCDRPALHHAFATWKPRLVFHAAAYKHVPIVEAQAREGVRNNVLGTHLVTAAADQFGCEACVLISTDKAVRPSSVMGATKRFAELLCEVRNQRSATRFITVRFGNVLGSAGSVVPLFQEQIKSGGPVTVTHPEATRYFMTIPEASQLILQAAAIGQGGEIYVLDMGEPVSISYLAEQMIRLSGRVPGRDIQIVYTGLRPGEKLKEELFRADENLAPTRHEKLLLAGHTQLDAVRIRELFEELMAACEEFAEERIRKLLTEAVPELSQTIPQPQNTTVVQFKRSNS